MPPEPSRGIALVILAAGESARLGTCKALVPLTPRPPLELLAEAGAVLAGPPALVVTGADDAAIRAAAPPGMEVLENPDWSRGRSGGVRLAADARLGFDLCIAPVDVPLVPAAVFEALRRAWEEAGSPPLGWLAPWVRDPGGAGHVRHGHPVVVGRGLLPALHPEVALRELRARAAPLLDVQVEALEILDDLDRPEDLDRLRHRSPS